MTDQPYVCNYSDRCKVDCPFKHDVRKTPIKEYGKIYDLCPHKNIEGIGINTEEQMNYHIELGEIQATGILSGVMIMCMECRHVDLDDQFWEDDEYGNCELTGAYCRKHNKVMNLYHYHNGHCKDFEARR